MLKKLILIVVFFGVFPLSVFAQTNIEQVVIVNEAILGDDLQFAITFDTEKKAEYNFSKIVFEDESISYKDSVSQSSFMSIVNGKVSQDTKKFQNKIYFHFKPTKVGTYNLPAMPYTIDNKEYHTRPMSFRVVDIPVDGNIAFHYQVLDGKRELFPSEEFTLRVILAIKEYANLANEPVIISNFSFLQSSLLEHIAESDPSMVVYMNGSPYKVRLMEASNAESFKGYNKVYFFDMKFRVLNSGIAKLENSVLKGSFQTGQTTVQRDIFGRRIAVPVVKAVYAKSNSISVDCLNLPTENVPESYNGAIGEFSFDVTCSSDTGVKVGDPVTVIISIKGKGNWDKVQVPPLHKYAQINDYFRVSDSQPPGLLNGLKTEKEFSVRLRVKSKLVTEIPPIEFSYFDVASKSYRVLQSKPIPIKVFENTKEVQIRDFSTKASEEKDLVADESEDGVEKEIFSLEPAKIEIKDIARMAYDTNHGVSQYLYYVSLLPFLTLGFMQLFKIFRSRELTPELQVTFKQKNAYGIFKEKVKEISFENSQNPYRDMGVCFDEFFRNRFPNKISIVDAELFKNLESSGLLTSDRAKNLTAIFEKIEDKRYASQKTGLDEFTELRRKLEEELKHV